MKSSLNAICRPKGFKASARACGLKKNNRLDLALIYSEVPALACGMFTTNKIAAHPVKICKKRLKGRLAQAIVVNSGNANCYTGEKGRAIAEKTAGLSARLLDIPKERALIASTGIIGKVPDFAKIRLAIPDLVKSLNGKDGSMAAEAIMTTDTHPKEWTRRVNIAGKIVTIGAIAKGVGMIAPNMATMLVFITTDAAIEYPALKTALKEAVDKSFNMITIDGCMSTNDSVIIMANALAGNKKIKLRTGDFAKFSEALSQVCLNLARMIILDAEGATKFITIEVSGAMNNQQAKQAALAVANSNLFKTAVYGENRNLGRVIAAAGASGAQIKENAAVKCSSLKNKFVRVQVDLKIGSGIARVYTSDLTPEYIRINAEYN